MAPVIQQPLQTCVPRYKLVRRSPLISDFGPHWIKIMQRETQGQKRKTCLIKCQRSGLTYSIFGNICGWLSVWDVGRLDTTIRCVKTRREFLLALRLCTFARIVDQPDMSCLDWLNKRGARMSELILRSPNIKCDALIQIIERCPDSY